MKEAFKNRGIPAAAAALLLAISLCGPAFAADKEGMKGSVSVTLTEQGEGGKAVAGAELILHHAGDIKDDGYNLAYVLTPGFEGSGLSLDDLRAEGLADGLAGYAMNNGIAGSVGKTDDKGSVCFDGLEPGLYLVMQEKAAPGYYPIAPFLVSVPMTSQDGTEWVYDVDASPKVEPVSDKPAPPPPDDTEPPPMIQTGQLNWPVPVLAVAGIILFAIGWTLTYLEGKKDGKKQGRQL